MLYHLIPSPHSDRIAKSHLVLFINAGFIVTYRAGFDLQSLLEYMVWLYTKNIINEKVKCMHANGRKYIALSIGNRFMYKCILSGH